MNNERLPEGNLVSLRHAGPGDATAEYLSWLNDPEVVMHLETVPQPYTMGMLQRYIADALADKTSHLFMVCEKATGRPVGTMRVHNVNAHHGTCNIGIMIGDRASRGKGMGTDAYQTGIRFAFGQLGIRKIWEAVNARNLASLAMFRKLGFHEEGRWKAHVRTGDGYDDKILLSLFSREAGTS
jgi:RimJ/RimL family protein N-acetyltransferase